MTATGLSQTVRQARVTISAVASPFARYASRRRFRRDGGWGSIISWADRMHILTSLLILVLCASCASADRITAERLSGNPILTPASSATLGENINGPSLVRVPGWVRNPLGRYHLYFAHHAGKHIRLAYADQLSGPWRVFEPGALQLSAAPSCYDHIASPDVHVDPKTKQILMYFHCPAGAARGTDIGQQKTFLARSADGIKFTPENEPLGPAYFRVFKWRGHSYSVVRGGLVLRSADMAKPFETGPSLFPSIPGVLLRHAAVDLRGDKLYVYYSRIGDTPERILVSTVNLSPDWMTWRGSEPQTVLTPTAPYEGVDRPIETSRPDEAQDVHQVRDPAIYREDKRTYLLYSIAGESGIAIAELRY